MSKSLSNPTTPVSVPQPRMPTPPSPATIRKMLANSNANESTRIPQPANGSAAITIPKLRRSLSMRARISSSCSSNANSTTTTTATNHMAEVDDSTYGSVSNSSHSYSSAGITENNCKNNKRSPIGASCPAINKKGLPNGVAGIDCSISNHKHREHGMVIKLIKFLLFCFAPITINSTCEIRYFWCLKVFYCICFIDFSCVVNDVNTDGCSKKIKIKTTQERKRKVDRGNCV